MAKTKIGGLKDLLEDLEAAIQGAESFKPEDRLNVGVDLQQGTTKDEAASISAATHFLEQTPALMCREMSAATGHGEMLFSQLETTTTEIQEREDCILVTEKDWIESEGITSDTPVCVVTVSMIQAILEWITGQEYVVEEIECRAMGHSADVFRISKVCTWEEN